MPNRKQEFKTVVFEDGGCSVVRIDPAQPRFLEIIASFYDAARARDYVNYENSQLPGDEEPAPEAYAPKEGKKALSTDISDRQHAVLRALRSMMDKQNMVEVRAADLAAASSIPLGSLHSVLSSLEKKQMIRTERQGSAKYRAIYEVLDTSRRATRSINGVYHDEGNTSSDQATG